MFVAPKFRRGGIGKALLGKMLRDDQAYGSRFTALLASHTGAFALPSSRLPTNWGAVDVFSEAK